MSIYVKIKPLRISAPSPKSWKYLYTKIMAYTVSAPHNEVNVSILLGNGLLTHTTWWT